MFVCKDLKNRSPENVSSPSHTPSAFGDSTDLKVPKGHHDLFATMPVFTPKQENYADTNAPMG